MKSRLYPFLVTGAFAAATLSSCTNIQDDQTRTRAEGAGAGALLGGALGAVIGHQSGRAGEGALLGAALGGGAGLAYGDHVARKKAANISQEEWLDQCIASARDANNKAYNYNRSLRGKIANLQSRINSARANGNQQELRSLRNEVTSLRKENQMQIKSVQSEISAQGTPLAQSSGSRAGTLRTEVNKLKSTEVALRSNDDRLASLQSSVDL